MLQYALDIDAPERESPLAQMTGGQALAHSLHREGVRVIFGLPGVQLYHALDGLHQQPDIRFITTRHEQATTYMADGYARAGRQVGTAMVVPGPGVLNAGAGLSDAYAASSPVFLVAGQVHREHIGAKRGVLHEVDDQLDLVRPITKWCSRVLEPGQIPDAVHQAFYHLRTGRPRPVEIEIPPDTLAEVADVELLEPAIYQPQGPDSSQIDHAAAMITGSHRPAIWAGGGVITSGASLALTRLAEHIQAPVITTREGKGAIDSRHHLFLGSDRGAVIPGADPFRDYLKSCDLVIGVGTRLVNPGLDPSQQVLQIDIDPEEIGRNHHNTAGVVGDARVCLEALCDALSSKPRGTLRNAELQEFRTERADEMARAQPQNAFVEALREAIPEDGVLVADQTQVGYACHRFYPAYHPATYLTSSYQGNLGYAFPTAMGAKVALPERAVVSVSGDGGFLFNSQELATAVQHGIGIVAVVFNDNAYGNVLRDQATMFQGRTLGVELHNPDFVKLAQAYGADAVKADSPRSLAGNIKEAIAGNRPTLIEVPVGPMPRL